MGELVARIRVALRHAAQGAGEAGEPVFVLGRLAGRSRPPAGFRRRRGNPSDAHRIPAADDDDQARRQGDHAPATLEGGLGAGQRFRDALSSRLHGPASAEDGSRRRPAAIPPDRTAAWATVWRRRRTGLATCPTLRAAAHVLHQDKQAIEGSVGLLHTLRRKAGLENPCRPCTGTACR